MYIIYLMSTYLKLWGAWAIYLSPLDDVEGKKDLLSLLHNLHVQLGGHKEMSGVVYLDWPVALSYMSPNAGGGGCGVSANEYSCAHGSQKNF